MRPNYAQDAPPTTITVGGCPYPIDVDFRTWVQVTRQMREFIPAPESDAQAQHNVDLMYEIQTAVFGGVLEDEEPGEVLRALSDFAQGYPSAPVKPSTRPSEPAYSFEHDLNYIILAIRNQSGVDLSYRRKEPFHWWEFLLEFQTLSGDHYILRLMEIRGYEKNPEKPERLKARYALPRETTAAEQVALKDINDAFYNT